METFVRMQGTIREVNQLLKQAAPAKFREMAALCATFRGRDPVGEIKQNYQELADIWEAKAKAAEIHQNDVAANLNNDLLDYIKDQNVFMERLLTMLNNGLVSKDLREFARFKNILQEIISKHEFLRETLRTWRARMQGEPTAPQPEPEPQRSEAGPAAPPPQVKHVAWSSSCRPCPRPPLLGLLGAGPGAGSGVGRRDERPSEDCGGRAAAGPPGPHEGGLCVRQKNPALIVPGAAGTSWGRN